MCYPFITFSITAPGYCHWSRPDPMITPSASSIRVTILQSPQKTWKNSWRFVTERQASTAFYRCSVYRFIKLNVTAFPPAVVYVYKIVDLILGTPRFAPILWWSTAWDHWQPGGLQRVGYEGKGWTTGAIECAFVSMPPSFWYLANELWFDTLYYRTEQIRNNMYFDYYSFVISFNSNHPLSFRTYHQVIFCLPILP